MLRRLDHLAAQRANFAIETTLSGKTLAKWVAAQRRDRGYGCQLVYVWPRSPEVALERVRRRVAPAVMLTERWVVFENKDEDTPRPIAKGVRQETVSVYDQFLWSEFCEQAQCR